MRPTYSITEASQKLQSIVEETEREECVQLTAHGKSVAVIVSMQVYEKLAVRKTDFGPAYEAFRAATPLQDLKIESDVFDVRDSSANRQYESDVTAWLETVARHQETVVARVGFLPDSTPEIAESRSWCPNDAEIR